MIRDLLKLYIEATDKEIASQNSALERALTGGNLGAAQIAMGRKLEAAAGIARLKAAIKDLDGDNDDDDDADTDQLEGHQADGSKP